ncbi:MAG: chromate transporter [Clostridiales bacterium]
MTYILLFWEFFKTGLLSIGGGYATLPFLVNISETYGWYTQEQLTNFIAISEVTPGAIGINMATFAGNVTAGLLGGIIATVALVLPAIIIILSLSTFVPNYRENAFFNRIFYGIIPVAMALLVGTGWRLFSVALLSFTSTKTIIGAWVLFIALCLLYLPKHPFKVSPFLLLFIGGIWGFVFF